MKIDINTKKEDTVKKMEIGFTDLFNLDGVLGRVIVACLEAFKKEEHAGFTVEDAHLPDHLAYLKPLVVDGKYTDEIYGGNSDPLHKERFNYIIDEMIFAFQSCYDSSLEDYWIPDPDYDPTQDTLITQADGSLLFNLDITEDDVKREAYEKRVRNGFNLFSRYYRSLWI